MPLVFCPLFSGSSGNALYIGTERTHILIDAGMPAKALSQALDSIGVSPASLSGILITHEHSDHIRGAGALSRQFDLPVYANEGTWGAMEVKLGLIAPKNQRIFLTGQDFYIDELGIAPFAIPHDTAEPVGFAVHAHGRKVAIATDLGHIHSTWLNAVAGAEVLLLESNHDLSMLERGPYPRYLKQRIGGRKGHLSNEDCGKALCQLAQSGVRHCVLGHLSHENNLPELAYATVRDALAAQGIRCGDDISLDMAWRDRVGTRYAIT